MFGDRRGYSQNGVDIREPAESSEIDTSANTDSQDEIGHSIALIPNCRSEIIPDFVIRICPSVCQKQWKSTRIWFHVCQAFRMAVFGLNRRCVAIILDRYALHPFPGAAFIV